MMTSIDGDVLLEELTVGTRPSVSELEVGGGNSSTPLRSGSGAASSLPSTPVAFTKEFARTATATTPTAAYSPFNPASMALSLDAYGAAPATVAMHGFSNPVLAAPMLQSQLMQMQNQMAMLSQVLFVVVVSVAHWLTSFPPVFVRLSRPPSLPNLTPSFFLALEPRTLFSFGSFLFNCRPWQWDRRTSLANQRNKIRCFASRSANDWARCTRTRK